MAWLEAVYISGFKTHFETTSEQTIWETIKPDAKAIY
jgi:hypothetical protein